MSAPLLAVRGLRAGYGAVEVLHGVDLDGAAGTIVAVLGRNGAGRSTLLRALIGLLPAGGSVRIDGVEAIALPPQQRARLGVGYVPETRDVFPLLSVRDNLLLGAKPGERDTAALLQQVLAAFPTLQPRLRTAAHALSGGERAMLALARCLMGRPKLLLLDEPAEGLAPQRVDELAARLRDLRAQGLGVLLVEQAPRLSLAAAADRAVLLGAGNVQFSGTLDALQRRADLFQSWL